MVVEVFLTERESVDALLDQLLDRMRDAEWVTLVGEAGGKPAENVGSVLDLAQQECTAITHNGTAVKAAHDFAFANTFKGEQLLDTLCHSGGGFLPGLNSFWINLLCHERRLPPMPLVRNYG